MAVVVGGRYNNASALLFLMMLLVIMEKTLATYTETVVIIHDLGYGDLYMPLWIHCKSGDTDLGARVLAPGETLRWSFKLSYWDYFFDHTLFYCYTSWGNKQHGYFKCAFDAFGGKAPRGDCRDQIWNVKAAGIYLDYAGCNSDGVLDLKNDPTANAGLITHDWDHWIPIYTYEITQDIKTK